MMMFASKLVLLLIIVVAIVHRLDAAAVPKVHVAEEVDVKANIHIPEEDMTPIELIRYAGYDGEVHHVTTADGYILEMERITSPRHARGSSAAKKPAFLLQHGLEGCSENYIGNLYNESLGFILADAGFDVWLANSRGNRYSTAHTHLDPKKDKKKFWDFSFQDMAEYDLPACIDYILEKTSQESIYYVGHSQGTMIMFARLADHPDFAAKIKTFFALAPVTKVGSIASPIRFVAPFADILETTLELLGIYAFADESSIGWLINKIKPLCDQALFEEYVCSNLMFIIAGPEPNKDIFNFTRGPSYFAHNPAGTSVKNVAHFGQLVNSNKFGKYDYGFVGNQKHYQQHTPPSFNLTQIKARVVAYWSEADELADPTDVAYLFTQLPVAESHHIEKYSHLDFIYATNAKSKVYDSIIKIASEQERDQVSKFKTGGVI